MLIVKADTTYKKIDGSKIKLEVGQAIDMGAKNNAILIDKKIVEINNPKPKRKLKLHKG